jgi:hypothetical protein
MSVEALGVSKVRFMAFLGSSRAALRRGGFGDVEEIASQFFFGGGGVWKSRYRASYGRPREETFYKLHERAEKKPTIITVISLLTLTSRHA